jgi:c-di-GMP-binding flagellar brake protein YcgR
LATLPQHNNDAEQFREISGKPYVLTLLQRLVQQRLLVTLHLPGSDERYTSTVLDISPESDSLLLDEVFPQPGQGPLQPALELYLYANLGGAALACTTQLLARVEEGGMPCYRVALPEQVNYLQRRDGHRVPVASLGIPLTLLDHNGNAHKGRLCDISTGGIGLVLEGAVPFAPQEIYRLTLQPPHESPLSLELEICTLRREGEGTVLGGAYTGLDKRTEHLIERLVAELERRQLRARWNPSRGEAAANGAAGSVGPSPV